jgi:predicted nucleic acid-binding Zn ribbon protein
MHKNKKTKKRVRMISIMEGILIIAMVGILITIYSIYIK